MRGYALSKMYCVNCGKEGIGVNRKTGQFREAGHLKNLWCPWCKAEHNMAEVRPVGSYTYEDFKMEFDLGRFVNDLRVPVKDLLGCSKANCPYNVNGRCWNANNSFDCGHRKVEND